MVETLNRHFVPVEFDATDFGGVPEVPALWPLSTYWQVLFSRINFSGEWVLDPEARHVLGVAQCKHGQATQPYAASLHQALESGWRRYASYRELAPGSSQRRAAEERAAAEGRRDVERNKACWLSEGVLLQHLEHQALVAGPEGPERDFQHDLDAMRRTAMRRMEWPAPAR